MFSSGGRTGQINYDVLVAAVILSSAVLAGYLFYSERALEQIYALEYSSCVLDCLRISDILIHTKLAVDVGGVKVSNVVDCSKLGEAYGDLVKKGFSGYVSCGGIEFGEHSKCKIVRKAVWEGRPVTVEVGE